MAEGPKNYETSPELPRKIDLAEIVLPSTNFDEDYFDTWRSKDPTDLNWRIFINVREHIRIRSYYGKIRSV